MDNDKRFEQTPFTRRQLMQGLAVASGVGAGLTALSTSAMAAEPPLKPVWVNHYTYVAPDLAKTRDWYQEVFGMQIGHKDAKTAHMWYGDTGGDTLMIIRQANPGEVSPRIEKFAFQLDGYDQKAVLAELKRRNIAAKVEDKTIWFNDLDGTEIGVTGKDYMKRPSAPAATPKLWKAISANHIVVESTDYKKLAAWYDDLFVLKDTTDAGRDIYQYFGPTVWIPTAVGQGKKTTPELKSLDHVALTIANYNSAAVEAELKRRQMIAADAKVTGSLGINCKDINGFKSQVCDANLVPDGDKRRPPVKKA